MSAIKQTVDSDIQNSFIYVASKSYCPYCKKAKALLQSLDLPAGQEIKVVELDQTAEGADIQNYLHEKTGQRTVPNIFIKGQHIGGSDDLAAAHSSGKLTKLIQA